MTTTAPAKKVKCAECDRPVMEVQNGVIVVRARHREGRHVTVFTKAQLDKLLEML